MPQSSSAAAPSATPPVIGFHHSSLIVADTAKALDFYVGVLALEIDASRPDLGYPGAWLNLGNGQIHLLEVDNPYAAVARPGHGGRDFHLALQVTDLQAVIERLTASKLDFSRSKSGREALFCRDFDGNAIELVEVAA